MKRVVGESLKFILAYPREIKHHKTMSLSHSRLSASKIEPSRKALPTSTPANPVKSTGKVMVCSEQPGDIMQVQTSKVEV